jgi:hypothetical protein
MTTMSSSPPRNYFTTKLKPVRLAAQGEVPPVRERQSLASLAIEFPMGKLAAGANELTGPKPR